VAPLGEVVRWGILCRSQHLVPTLCTVFVSLVVVNVVIFIFLASRASKTRPIKTTHIPHARAGVKGSREKIPCRLMRY
jgi:hypothetical protein